MDLTRLPPLLRELVSGRPLQPLGPGRPHEEKRAALAALKSPQCFSPHVVGAETMAQACLAGLWLAYDFLDASHSISQDLDSVEGSYWHALMHRREPDYWNSKYWFRRVGNHPIFARLTQEAAAMRATRPDVPGALASAWDPFAFVDLCERAARDPSLEALCRDLQQREWELLFEHCLHAAIGPKNAVR